MTTQIFKTSEIKSGATGYTVDLSDNDAVNPDKYFSFKTLREARRFAHLISQGYSASEAMYEVSSK